MESNRVLKYKLKYDHSYDSFKLTDNNTLPNEEKITYNYEIFKEELFSLWNKQKSYKRSNFLSLPLIEFKAKERNFLYNPGQISNFLIKWKKLSDNFNVNIIFKKINTLDGRNVLKLYFKRYVIIKSHPKGFLLEFNIWITDYNIKELINAKHIFIDGIFYVPCNYIQMLHIIYYDQIINKRIVVGYILINSQDELVYNLCFCGFKFIITCEGLYDTKLE